MKIYLNQLNSGLLTIGLENAFQFHIAENVSNILKINRYRETAFKAIEEYLCSIVQNVATNKEFLKQVQAVLGYSFENSPEFGIFI